MVMPRHATLAYTAVFASQWFLDHAGDTIMLRIIIAGFEKFLDNFLLLSLAGWFGDKTRICTHAEYEEVCN